MKETNNWRNLQVFYWAPTGSS